MTTTRVCTTDGALLETYLGKNVFVRTVTFHYTGRLEAADDHFLLLADAAWIADDGRFTQALADGELSEIEPFPGMCLVNRGALLDVCEWEHELPRAQK